MEAMEVVVNLVQKMYQTVGITLIPNIGDVAGLLGVIFFFLTSLTFFFGPSRKKIEAKEVAVRDQEASEEAKKEEQPQPPKVTGPSWTTRLKMGLARSRHEIWGKIDSLLAKNSLDEETLEEIEELLYSADIGPSTVSELIGELSKSINKDGNMKDGDFKKFMFNFLKEKMNVVAEADEALFTFKEDIGRPVVLMVVGVNGAGKTTTIGKLATKLTRQGAKVVVGACDTFRAAAVDQLQVWCDRAGADMIRAKEGVNPSGVAYDALDRAIKVGANYCILDTAGRLHTKGSLMEELKKNKRVLKKLDPSAPDHTLLVIDAITGQNALRQAEEFNEALELTGLLFTKCDSSSKAGSAISIVNKLKVPITYIGVGESVEDLDRFNLDEYLSALLEA